jgi:hypothetical protein
MPSGNVELVHTVASHVEKHVGPIAHFFHWPGPEIVHVDVLHVPPTTERPCHTLVTCGMSQRPMCAPEAAPDCRYAELYLSLPPDWPVRVDDAEERHVWPIRELAGLARLPHLSESWLWCGHTVGHDDPRDLITPGAGFTAWIVGPHLSLGHEGCSIRCRDRNILIMGAVPIYPEELDLVRRRGPDALYRRLAADHVCDLVEVGRRNVALRR